jgi:hypothetical protein
MPATLGRVRRADREPEGSNKQMTVTNALRKQNKNQVNNAETAMSFDEYLLAELRCASLRAKILQSEIDAIGIALKGGMVTAKQAIVLMHGVDLLRFIGPEPAESQ